jgi:MYXO-CTERM domain-containing protein
MPVRSLCRPPYYGGQIGSDLGVPTTAPTGSGGGTATGGGKGTGTGTTTPTPEANNADDGEAHESSACQFGQVPASRGVVSILALLGAVIGLSRRRRQQAQG